MIAKQIQLAFERSVGMSCFFAYFALVVFRHTDTLLATNPLIIVVFGLVLVSAYIVVAFLADAFDRIGPAVLSAIATALCIAGLLILDFSLHVGLSLGGGIVGIIGCVLFSFIWGKNLAFYSHQQRVAIIPASFFLGAAIVALFFALNTTAAIVATSCLPLVSALHLQTLRDQKDTFSFTNLEDSRKDYTFSLSVLFTTALTGFCWGIGFFLLMRSPDLSHVAPLCFSLPIIIGCIVLFFDALFAKKINEENLLRWFAIAAIIPIALLPFMPGWAKLLCGSYFFMYFTINTMMNISAIAETAHFNQISPYWVFGVSLSYYFAGAVASFLLFTWVFDGGTYAAQSALCLGSVFLIVWSSDFVFQDNYPGKEALENSIEVNKSLCLLEKRPALWQKKINYIADTYELTARQKEVFRMLIRGRNAQFIAQEFYISYSTAKAHIHNIYSKLDIHSQQELIDLVEEAPVEPDAETQTGRGPLPPHPTPPPGTSSKL